MKGYVLGSLNGGRPVRKRGYYRALKRKEHWALLRQAERNMMNNLSVDLYCPENRMFFVGAPNLK